MTEMATGALMFLRGDVRAARQTIERSYSRQQVMDSRRLPRTEQPYFTPGFPLSLPLEHGVRIRSLDGRPAGRSAASDANPIISDTKELSWYTSPAKTGLVTVDTDRTQALIGFIRQNGKAVRNLSAEIGNNFAAIVLSSLDAMPLARSGRMLLTTGSRVSNTGLKWNDARTRAASQGESPSLVEPVSGAVILRGLEGAVSVSATALDGSGHAIGDAIQARKTAGGWSFPIGDPVTTWYAVTVKRK